MPSSQPIRKRHLIARSLVIGILLASAASSAAKADSVDTDNSQAAANVESVPAATAVAPTAANSALSTDSTAAETLKDQGSTKPAPTVRLHAEVVNRTSPELSKGIDDLNFAALDKIRRAELLEKEKHYRKGIAKLAASGRDLAELCTAYRGFEQSSEAADIILDEKVKLKSGPSVAYAKQKQSDTVHERIITSMMQIATGIGATDKDQSKAAIDEGVAELAELTDKEQAQKTAEMLKNWCQSQKVVFPPLFSGPMQIQAECKDVIGRAIQQDQVVKQITASLHKYNGRSKFARATAKVVNTTLSIAALSPTLISPASQIAWTAYIMTQGGPEESKLLKEVYLAKRFENRFQTLNSETSLAVNSYNSALISQNSPLLAFSQFMVGQLCEPPVPAVRSNEVAGKETGVVSKVSAGKPGKVANKDSSNPDDIAVKDSNFPMYIHSNEGAEQDSASKPGEVASKGSSTGTPQ